MTDYAEPKFPTIIFGDGQLAQLIKMRPCGQDEEGIDITEITIRPTPEMRYFYNIDEIKDLDTIGSIIRRFPSKYILPLGHESSLDPTSGSILILCNWNWEPTVLTRHYPSLELLEDYQKQLLTLKKENARLHRDMKDLMANNTEYFKNVGTLVQQIKKFTGQPEYVDEQPPVGEY